MKNFRKREINISIYKEDGLKLSLPFYNENINFSFSDYIDIPGLKRIVRNVYEETDLQFIEYELSNRIIKRKITVHNAVVNINYSILSNSTGQFSFSYRFESDKKRIKLFKKLREAAIILSIDGFEIDLRDTPSKTIDKMIERGQNEIKITFTIKG